MDMQLISQLIAFFSYVIIYLLSFVGLLLRALETSYFSCRRQPSSMPASAVVWCLRRTVLFLYPWVYLWDRPSPDITRTPFGPTTFSLVYTLLIHMLWLTSSVGFWTYAALDSIVQFLTEGYADNRPGVVIFIKIYLGVFAASSSLMWLLSLGGSLVHLWRMNSVRDGGASDDARHYLAPFRKATVWAFVSLPILFGWIVLAFVADPTPFE